METHSKNQKPKKQAHVPQPQAASSSEDRLQWNIYDQRLLPKFLLSVLDAHLPAGESPTPRALSALVNDVQKHGLLQVDQSTVPGMAPAFAAWRKRVDTLLANQNASDQWAAASLVALTAQTAALALIADASTTWLPALATMLKPSVGSALLHATVCKAIGAVLHRLAAISAGGAQALHRVHSGTASKLVSALVQQLATASDAQFGALLEVLSGVLAAFPSSLKQHAALMEEALVRCMLAEGKRARLQLACASCLSQLPRIQGDAPAWSLLVRKLMLALHAECRIAFAGMEHASQHDAAMLLLAPQANVDGTPELAGYSLPSRLADGRLPAHLPRISALLASLKGCMSRPLRFAVPLPCHLILGLASRILYVDGSAVRADPYAPQGGGGGGRGGLLGAADPKRRFATWEALPALHLEALSLLEALLHASKRHLLPHAGSLARLLADCLRRCGTPSLAQAPQGSAAVRERLYQTAQALMVGLGSGFALQVAAPLVTQALRDLSMASVQAGPRGAGTFGADGGGDDGGSKKKRKGGGHGSASDYTLVGSTGMGAGGLGGGEDSGGVTLGVQKEALATINLLLVTAGSLIPERYRALVDTAVARAALASASQLAARRDDDAASAGVASWRAPCERVCLAAHQALLSSVTVPRAHASPPYLTTALRLFQRGRSEGSPALAAFCASATATLEAILHPRAAPRRVPPPLFPDDGNDDDGVVGTSGGGANKRARMGADASQWEEVDEVLDAHRARARARVPDGSEGGFGAADMEGEQEEHAQSGGRQRNGAALASSTSAGVNVPGSVPSEGAAPGPAPGAGRPGKGGMGLSKEPAAGKQREEGAAGVTKAGDAGDTAGDEAVPGKKAGKSGQSGKGQGAQMAAAKSLATAAFADGIEHEGAGARKALAAKRTGNREGLEADALLPGEGGDDDRGGTLSGAGLGMGLRGGDGLPEANREADAAAANAARPLPAVGVDDDSEVDSEGSLPSIVDEDDEDED